jgi:hypothetical protein
MEKFVFLLIRDIFKEGAVEFGVLPDLEEKLKKIDDKLDLDNLTANKAKIEEVANLIGDSLKTHSINIMMKNKDALKINFAVKELLIKSLVKLLMSDEPEGFFFLSFA